MDKNKIILGLLIVLFVLSMTFFVRITQNGYYSDENPASNIDKNNLLNVEGNNYEDDDYEYEEEDYNLDNLDSDINDNGGNAELIPLSELAKHDSKDDCWIAYDGKAYDITSFIPRHPGGENKIIPYCGSADEFEKAFTNQHGTSKVSNLMKIGVFIGDFDVMGSI